MRAKAATRAPATASMSAKSTSRSSRRASSPANASTTRPDAPGADPAMRLVHWVVTIPAAGVLAVFAISNRESATVAFWPLPARIEAPLYLVVLLALLVGFLVGELVAWINAGRARRLARERRRRIEAL